jgi:ABC-type uncharacterized transport system YnjBCD substrate-binding protein
MIKYFTSPRCTRLASLLLCCCFAFMQQVNAQVVFTDAYASGVSFVAFGGSTNLLAVDNTEYYNGTASLKISVPAGGYTGGAFQSSTPLNLTSYNAVSFWAKASAAKTLNVVAIMCISTAHLSHWSLHLHRLLELLPM